jgi:competence protein ComEC
VVVRLRTHGVTVLFAGDLENDAQAELRGRGVDLRADVLKVPHHGSARQDPAFLDAVRAQVALTPVGAGNPYGHPAAATMDRLVRDGMRVHRSDRDGDVAVVVRDGRISTVARGADGAASLRASGHHDPGTAAAPAPVPAGLARPVLGLPFWAQTRCDTVGPYPVRPRARSPTASTGRPA